MIYGQTPTMSVKSYTLNSGKARYGCFRVIQGRKFAIDLPDASVAIQVSGTLARARKKHSALAESCAPSPRAKVQHFIRWSLEYKRSGIFAKAAAVFD